MPNYNEIPIIRIELDRVRRVVQTMLINSNDDLNEMVTQSLEKHLNEEWVKAEIDNNVKELIKLSINDMTKNWELRQLISKLVNDAVTSIVSKD